MSFPFVSFDVCHIDVTIQVCRITAVDIFGFIVLQSEIWFVSTDES